MRKKIYGLALILMGALLSGHGQQLKTYTNKNYGTSDGQTGTLTYTYYEDASGNYVKHGKYSINASLEISRYWNREKRTYQNFHNQHATNATFKDGWLDGTVTITVKKTTEENKIKATTVQTETVNFKNGVPHGLWKIVETYDNKTSTLISMSFTDGVLTGSFQWSNMYSGEFDSKGQYSGKWTTTTDNRTFTEYNFINGIKISEIIRKDGNVTEKTPDEDIAIAKQFANGEISESELEGLKYQLAQSDGLFYNLLPTKPFYVYHYDLDKIGGDKTLELENHEKTLGKPFYYLRKIENDFLPDNLFNCILVDLGYLKTCENYTPVLKSYQQSLLGILETSDNINIKGKYYYMTREQVSKLIQYDNEKDIENAMIQASEDVLEFLTEYTNNLSQDSIFSLLDKLDLSRSVSEFLPIVYYSVDSSTKNDNRTDVFCTIVKKIEDKTAPYQTWKSAFVFEEKPTEISHVKDATLNFNEAQRVAGPFEAIMEMRNTIKKEEKVIMSLEEECPTFVNAYTSYKGKKRPHFEDLEKLLGHYEKPEAIKEHYEKITLPFTMSFANLARQYKTIKETHNEILEKSKNHTEIQQSYLDKVGEKPYEMGDMRYYYFTEGMDRINDTSKLKRKYVSVSSTQSVYLDLINIINIRDKNRSIILNYPDKACMDVVNWYKKSEKNFDQSITGTISDITQKTKALIDFQNTTLKFINLRKQISKQNELIIANTGEFAKDVNKAYQSYAKNYDVSITADTVESFNRLLQLSTIQDTCLAFIAYRKLIADNDAIITEKNKTLKNIAKVYSTYMKSADLAWVPDHNCCDKLRNVIDIQEQFLTAVNASNASELDLKIKRLKDKSLENVLKELK
jgi:hypothetical protein